MKIGLLGKKIGMTRIYDAKGNATPVTVIEAGGNTAEVLDRVAEVIRGRMELRRLVEVLTAQAKISRWILTALPIFVFLSLIFTGGDFLDPMINSLVGRIALVFSAIMIMVGSFWIKQLAKLDV